MEKSTCVLKKSIIKDHYYYLLPDLHGQFYENTVVVQYDKDLLEVWDEAKRLRCEWFNDYEKTASKPPMVIADLDVVQLDFRGKVIP